MDNIFKWDGVAGRSALRSEIAGRSALLELLETVARRSALPELLEAAEDMKRCMAFVREVGSLKSLSCAMTSEREQVNML